MSEISVVLMGKIGGKYSTKESCCCGLSEYPRFPAEAAVIYSALKQQKRDVSFYDGNLWDEEKILLELSKKNTETVLLYLYTPYIRDKKDFMKQLSQKCKQLVLVAVPFFWPDKIISDFPFIHKVIRDEESFFNLDTKNTIVCYDDLYVEKYLELNKNIIFPVLFTKYCPYGCTFCNVRNMKRRERTADVLIKEIEILYKKYKIKNFYIQDNQVTFNRQRLQAICSAFQKFEWGFSWRGSGRFNEVDEEILRLVKKSKCRGLLFGVESANQDILKRIDKRIEIKKVIDMARIHKRIGMNFKMSFMFGFPWDSEKSLQEMVSLIDKTQPTFPLPGPVAAYPSTPLFEQIKQLKLINENELDYSDFSWEKLEEKPFSTLYLSSKEVNKAFIFLKRYVTKYQIKKSLISFRCLRAYLQEFVVERDKNLIRFFFRFIKKTLSNL